MSASVHAAIIEHDADSLRCPELLVAATPAALRVQVATRLAELIAHGETEHDDLAAFADERPWEQVDPADDSAVARWLDEHREASTVPWANLGYTITIAADPGMVAVAQPF
jgi:hypothetical protein